MEYLAVCNFSAEREVTCLCFEAYNALKWPQRQSGLVRQTRCSIVANMYKIVDDPEAIIHSIPKLKPLVSSACGKIYKLHDGHLYWYKQQRLCTFTYKRLRVVAEIGSLHIFVLNVEALSWSHGDTSTLFQVVRGLHRCIVTFNIIVSHSIRTYIKSLTYKRAPLGMEELLGHAWSGRLAAASVTFAKMEVISAIGLSLATLREVCRLCSAVDGDNDAAWTESTIVVMDDNKVLILVSNERIPFTPTTCMLLVSQDMKHTSPATFSHGVVLSINEPTSCRKSSMRKFERQARDRASSPRPSRRVLRGPRRRSPSLLRYTVSQASKVERIGSRFLELVCSLPNVSPSAPCRRGDCRV